jgi:GPN-loop GTPase
MKSSLTIFYLFTCLVPPLDVNHPALAMPFGEIVIGSPGSGKSTYSYGKYQLLTAINRKCIVVNLDPANDPAPYPTAISLSELITLEDVMREGEDGLGLGPNGGMLYCIEYLEQNLDWLEGRLKEELGTSQDGPDTDTWVIFDLPGQVELSTNHESLKNIVEKLSKIGFRVSLYEKAALIMAT